MFIDQLHTAGALPTLAATMRFAGQRQQLIAHNIANFETPNYRPRDVSPASFQRMLGEAVQARRESNGGTSGALPMGGTREIAVSPRGELSLKPRTASGNILFHDRNNRDLERTMQAMVENSATFRVAADFMRSRGGVIRSAIAERVS